MPEFLTVVSTLDDPEFDQIEVRLRKRVAADPTSSFGIERAVLRWIALTFRRGRKFMRRDASADFVAWATPRRRGLTNERFYETGDDGIALHLLCVGTDSHQP